MHSDHHSKEPTGTVTHLQLLPPSLDALALWQPLTVTGGLCPPSLTPAGSTEHTGQSPKVQETLLLVGKLTGRWEELFFLKFQEYTPFHRAPIWGEEHSTKNIGTAWLAGKD